MPRSWLLLCFFFSCKGAEAPAPPSPPFACSSVTVSAVNAGRTFPGGACHLDSECNAKPQGRCVVTDERAHERPTLACVYDDCASDLDCTKGNVCICGTGSGTSRNQCVPGNCHVPTVGASVECGAFPCAASYSAMTDPRGRKIEGYFCRKNTDTCRSDRDCDREGASACVYRAELGRFACLAISDTE